MEKVDWDQRYVDSNTPWDSGTPSEVLSAFLDDENVQPGRALELGCGTGTNAIFLAQRGFEVTAVDLSATAIKMAKEKAEKAGCNVNFVQADVTALPDIGAPFPFVFDRGTYHVVRGINLEGLQSTLSHVVARGGFYLVLAGSANENAPPDNGPPRVTAHDLCRELEGTAFDLVRLEESNFHGIRIEGQEYKPVAWKAILRRREIDRVSQVTR
ncbi:MAG: class I SAM-dependent methyltransferase [Candidatus Obscuribacterales bacterium]|nr:class I SAM-dependent methyltransferase [Candidatus Obscuribacterales bacterium]